jgi:hypothetical protein
MTERVQERHARALHDKLVSLIGPAYPGVEIAIRGAGVNWRCTVQTAHHTSIVHCFDDRGPEYLTVFQRNGEQIATGRSPSPDETVDAILRWLADDSLSALYDRFPFVDQRKRELVLIRESVVGFAAQLLGSCELQERDSGICFLWFRKDSRSALIYFYGKEQDPDVICHWDECALFSYRAADRSMLGPVLKRWLCDTAVPSTMRSEFPWLAIGELADYYERGNPIEGEFVDSWNRIEQFYERFTSKDRVLRFVGELRRDGYDRKLRAGQSMWTFILSRSRRHGLRADQARIQFQFSSTDDAMVVTVRTNEEESTFTTKIARTYQLNSVLSELLDRPVD